ncbi:MAG: Hsp20/alpha crystallin family protein [Silvanigrellales bacterium]|nr:Hsp20/alpha crystallin family protein [Silvanigrellales bacterium]
MRNFDTKANGSRGETQGSNNTSDESRREVSEGRALLPAVDIQEDESGIFLHADMPGVPKEGLAIELEGDVLSIEGEIQLDIPPKLATLYNEVHGRRYARSFTLSKELDATRIQATLEQGVLKLHIPKAEALKPRKIEVRVAQ